MVTVATRQGVIRGIEYPFGSGLAQILVSDGDGDSQLRVLNIDSGDGLRSLVSAFGAEEFNPAHGETDILTRVVEQRIVYSAVPNVIGEDMLGFTPFDEWDGPVPGIGEEILEDAEEVEDKVAEELP